MTKITKLTTKDDDKPTASSSPAGKNWTAPAPETLVIGEQIFVKVQPDVVLVNTETGARFVPDVATPQKVTTTTIARLRDGDLQQVAAPNA